MSSQAMEGGGGGAAAAQGGLRYTKFDPARGWRGRVTGPDGKLINTNYYATELEAAQAADRILYKLRGPEACQLPVSPELAAELDALTLEQVIEQFREVGARKLADKKTSQHKGVGWHKGESKWRAQLRVPGAGMLELLYSHDEEATAQGFDAGAYVLHGPDAQMNFPERYAHLTPEQGRALAMASLGEAKVARLEAIKNGQAVPTAKRSAAPAAAPKPARKRPAATAAAASSSAAAAAPTDKEMEQGDLTAAAAAEPEERAADEEEPLEWWLEDEDVSSQPDSDDEWAARLEADMTPEQLRQVDQRLERLRLDQGRADSPAVAALHQEAAAASGERRVVAAEPAAPPVPAKLPAAAGAVPAAAAPAPPALPNPEPAAAPAALPAPAALAPDPAAVPAPPGSPLARAPRPEDEPGAAEFQQWLHEFMEGTRSLTPEDFQDMKYDATYDWVKLAKVCSLFDIMCKGVRRVAPHEYYLAVMEVEGEEERRVSHPMDLIRLLAQHRVPMAGPLSHNTFERLPGGQPEAVPRARVRFQDGRPLPHAGAAAAPPASHPDAPLMGPGAQLFSKTDFDNRVYVRIETKQVDARMDLLINEFEAQEARGEARPEVDLLPGSHPHPRLWDELSSRGGPYAHSVFYRVAWREALAFAKENAEGQSAVDFWGSIAPDAHGRFDRLAREAVLLAYATEWIHHAVFLFTELAVPPHELRRHLKHRAAAIDAAIAHWLPRTPLPRPQRPGDDDGKAAVDDYWAELRLFYGSVARAAVHRGRNPDVAVHKALPHDASSREITLALCAAAKFGVPEGAEPVDTTPSAPPVTMTQVHLSPAEQAEEWARVLAHIAEHGSIVVEAAPGGGGGGGGSSSRGGGGSSSGGGASSSRAGA